METAAITVGPVKNLTAIANAATVFPHAIIRGCSAMNNPTREQQLKRSRSERL